MKAVSQVAETDMPGSENGIWETFEVTDIDKLGMKAASEATDTNRPSNECSIRAASDITDTDRPGSDDVTGH